MEFILRQPFGWLSGQLVVVVLLMVFIILRLLMCAYCGGSLDRELVDHQMNLARLPVVSCLWIIPHSLGTRDDYYQFARKFPSWITSCHVILHMSRFTDFWCQSPLLGPFYTSSVRSCVSEKLICRKLFSSHFLVQFDGSRHTYWFARWCRLCVHSSTVIWFPFQKR